MVYGPIAKCRAQALEKGQEGAIRLNRLLAIGPRTGLGATWDIQMNASNFGGCPQLPPRGSLTPLSAPSLSTAAGKALHPIAAHWQLAQAAQGGQTGANARGGPVQAGLALARGFVWPHEELRAACRAGCQAQALGAQEQDLAVPRGHTRAARPPASFMACRRTPSWQPRPCVRA